MRAMPQAALFLIDDHALFRSGLGMVLRSGIADLHLREAGSLEEAMRDDAGAPDALLLDIKLHGLNGLEGIALLKRKWPKTPIVMLSSDTAPETRRLALERGAAAFISKAETADNMLAVIKQVLGGAALTHPFPKPSADAEAQPHLTPRQFEVLDLLCQGLPNKVIGKRLGLSENTVRLHVGAILKSLQVTSRSEAGFVARQRGLVA